MKIYAISSQTVHCEMISNFFKNTYFINFICYKNVDQYIILWLEKYRQQFREKTYFIKHCVQRMT